MCAPPFSSSSSSCCSPSSHCSLPAVATNTVTVRRTRRRRRSSMPRRCTAVLQRGRCLCVRGRHCPRPSTGVTWTASATARPRGISTFPNTFDAPVPPSALSYASVATALTDPLCRYAAVSAARAGSMERSQRPNDRIKVLMDGRHDVMLARQVVLNCGASHGLGAGCDGGESFDVFEMMHVSTARQPNTEVPAAHTLLAHPSALTAPLSPAAALRSARRVVRQLHGRVEREVRRGRGVLQLHAHRRGDLPVQVLGGAVAHSVLRALVRAGARRAGDDDGDHRARAHHLRLRIRRRLRLQLCLPHTATTAARLALKLRPHPHLHALLPPLCAALREAACTSITPTPRR